MVTARNSTTAIVEVMSQLEELWKHLDTIFDSLSTADWKRKHGKDWVFGDVPFHLAYFDREIAVKPIQRGSDIPADARLTINTMRQLNQWNADQFALRPSGQTPQESLAQARAVRDEIRTLAGTFSDADLDRPAWMPLIGFTGWRTVRFALESVLVHSWSHLTQMRLHLKKAEPIPSPAITRVVLDFYLGVMAAFLNKDAAAGKTFTAVMSISGPGGGDWTYRVENASCTVSRERPTKADLVMTQSPETFVKTMNKMHNPVLAMLTGAIKVKGFGQMATFGKLFAEPALDTVVDPVP